MKKPPRFAEWILQRLLEPSEREFIIGDLKEIYRELAESTGRIQANTWYLKQIIRSIRPFLYNLILWRIVMLKSYLKTALRNLRRHKGYAFINVTGLAIGMTCCILIFLWVKNELSYDRFHPKAERLFLVRPNVEGLWWQSSPLALAPRLKQDFPEIEKSVRFAFRQRTFRKEDKIFNETGAYVGANFFDMFSFPLLAGDSESLFADKMSIVVSEDFAARFFKSEDPLGKVVTLNNQLDLRVTGVLKNVPLNSTLQFDFLIPIQLYTNEERLNTSWSSELQTFILMRENTNIPALQAKLKDLLQIYDTRAKHNKILGIQNMEQLHLYNMAGGGPIVNVRIFSNIAALILLIACINFINLITARSGKRAKEIGVRKVVGAVRSDIIKQFYSEAMITTFSAMLISCLLVYLLLPSFNTLAQKQLSFSILLNPAALFALFGITLLTGLISGSYPSMRLSSFRPAAVLKSSFIPKARGLNMWRVLIVFQFITTIVLIIGSIINYQQMRFIQSRDLGLNKDQIVAIPIISELRTNYTTFKERLKANPAVVNITAASSYPTRINLFNPVYWEGKTKEEYIRINQVVLDYDYFKTFEMEMAMGRSFSKEFSTDATKYIINEAALELTGLSDPLGKMFSIWEEEGEIIGVVKDFHNQSLHFAISPTVFTLNPRHSLTQIIFVKVRPENLTATVTTIESLIQELAPSFPVSYTFVDDVFNQQYSSDRQVGSIFKYFTILAIFISCLGLLGISSFMAEQRTKEIGVRRVLGASVQNIVGLLSKEFLMLICAANLIAWPVAYFIMNKWLQNFVYRIDLGILVFVLTGILSLFIAIVTISFQSIKAARARPVEALRYE